MIVIDGKEAGGQILRTSLGLSAITGEPIKVINIRSSRKGGIGLKTQHLEGVLAVAQLCNAEVKGVALGSTEIEFIPKKLENKELNIRISTAGSIGLLYQSLQIPSAFTSDMVRIHVIGGSVASLWSPTIEYVQNVFLPIVRKMGYNAEIKVIKHGFYPKGGAEVEIVVHPIKRLNSIELTNPGKVKKINIISIAGSLPGHVAIRQAESAKKYLEERNFKDIEIKSETVETYSPGTSITLWAETENSVLGSDNLGKKGIRAEDIGREAAQALIKSIESNAALDKFMADQVIPFLALAHGESEIKVEEITEHVRTNIKVTELMLGVKFNVDEKSRIIKVKGIGFTNPEF
ncbi:MAG: RNA 3'-terminal phosphate cyclase [Thermoproteota archaeon]|nr:RNA 3'-terminal phosphate cyclase [Candidatus Brockarchaeota archaeon]